MSNNLTATEMQAQWDALDKAFVELILGTGQPFRNRVEDGVPVGLDIRCHFTVEEFIKKLIDIVGPSRVSQSGGESRVGDPPLGAREFILRLDSVHTTLEKLSGELFQLRKDFVTRFQA